MQVLVVIADCLLVVGQDDQGSTPRSRDGDVCGSDWGGIIGDRDRSRPRMHSTELWVSPCFKGSGSGLTVGLRVGASAHMQS